MQPQNIFDNEVFFQGYKKLRENPNSANILEEKPAIFSLLPELTGKKVLDLGCGYGENCNMFSKMGANKVVGIDVSSKMLAIANNDNSGDNIFYENMCMEDIFCINEKFDVVVSSLAVHYINDFNKLVCNVNSLLKDNGIFVFSQEHPLTTAPKNGARWFKNVDGRIAHYVLTDYATSGERTVSWIVDGITKYHRTFSDIVNALIDAGFIIEKMLEPVPTKEIIERDPSSAKDLHKPNFLVTRARKK
ncbi:Ubiquinone/menaquinone biosynthesis methyltransferase UBIE [Methanosarcina barkeri str. Wiesmoor]|uniref:Ubiquinone/menaquinone biosynthesis methyltransferase UBIE n=2 Tax=Methanosarcina barkeri TaxID=2208 RepID=A0A0E3QIW4_METBA|nr:class I SAM-dependent methyltransferase [Methanosarcina barkeri]AKB49828.1 Ubiquinone/menaquinone biosynthesis methyltransferase UBIE [Methanosarcina barkeri str. Wiesmoor]